MELTWIDLSDELEEGKWVDSEGKTTSYLPWAPSIDAPNGGINQNCAYQQGGKWDDAHCDNTNDIKCVLCEKPPTTPGI